MHYICFIPTIIQCKMAEKSEQEFNRSGLTVCHDRAWYTGQQARRVPKGLIGVVGVNCRSLDLSYNELTSLSALKDFPYLQELVLDNNELKDLNTLPEILSLHTLSLNNNKISDIDFALERIRLCCPQVNYVSLLGNPGCPDQLTHPEVNDDEDYDRYRIYAVHVLPETLKFLDSRQVTRRERMLAESRGKFFRTVKFDGKDNENVVPICSSDVFDETDFHVNYTPLPTAVRTPQDHKALQKPYLTFNTVKVLDAQNEEMPPRTYD